MPAIFTWGLVPVALSWLLASFAPYFVAADSDVPVKKVAAGAVPVSSAQVANKADLDGMLQELQQVRGELAVADGSKVAAGSWEKQMKDMEDQLEELEEMLQALEVQEKSQRTMTISHQELKAEIERLRKAVKRIEGSRVSTKYSDARGADAEKKKLTYHVGGKDGGKDGFKGSEGGTAGKVGGSAGGGAAGTGAFGNGGADGGAKIMSDGSSSEEESFGVGEKAGPGAPHAGRIDIDAEMPYGDLEPFGREDTAQELTEASIRESDEMVDQLERAEVAEEKRAVFRALTRLRGAAITSFDGVARSQTGNIDEYNKVNKWRTSHPIHHLANEESDVSKWAFPDNADF